MALADRTGTRVDTALFLASLMLSLVALALPEGLREPLASYLRRSLLFPVLSVQKQTTRSAEFRTRLDVLRAQRDSLALAAGDVPELLRENLQLRGLLGLGNRLSRGFVPAEVLHQAGVTDGQTLLLSAGARQGVEVLSPVVAPEGLVGLVRFVDPRLSVALVWTHPDFRASAVVEGGAVYGVVAARRGENVGEVMELRGVPYRERLVQGTRVVTSGLGGVFPRGIPVGTVRGILSESAGWERTYLLRPAVHPSAVSHVIILSRARSADTLTGAFQP